MAEPLSIASGIAGLISLTIEVCKITHTFIQSVTDASSAVERFLRELENIKIVLVKIEQLTTGLDKQHVFKDGSTSQTIANENSAYLDLLTQIRKRLIKRITDGSFKSRIKTLTWPFSEEKTLSLIDSLHRHISTYNTALAVDNLVLGQQTLSKIQHVNDVKHEAQVQAILDWLSPLSMHQKQHDTLSRRHAGTGGWLLAHSAFREWVDGDGTHRVLWCPGDPGTGKTVITSIVVDHLIQSYSKTDIYVAFVYCDYKDQVVQSASNLIACLARQLIGRSKKLPSQLENLHQDLQHQRRRPTLEELKQLLTTLCNQYERAYIVVDALDECDAMDERKHFLPLLKSLPQGSARLFVTSRPNNEDIYKVFSDVPRIVISIPENEIRRFVTEKIEEKEDFMERVTPELKNTIISTISSQASGMFLLAVFQIDRIFVARTIKRIKLALTTMPKELDDLYRETIQRIQTQIGDDGELGMRILSWIMHTNRPLSVDELRHGLAVEFDDEYGPSEEFDQENLLSARSLVDVCAGLVTIDPQSQIIRLVHYTTQEYLDKERARLFSDADLDISKACLTYLSYKCMSCFPSDSVVSSTLTSHPFLAYATIHWLSHVERCSASRNIFSQAVAYVRALDKIFFSSMVLRKLLLRPSIYSRLFEGDLKKALLPFEASAECGFLELLKFLLDNVGVGSTRDLRGALHYASSGGHTDVVKLLVERGVNPTSMAGYSYNALHKACTGGHLEVARVLLQHCFVTNMSDPDRWGWTPLHHAAFGSHSDVVKLLLSKGANPNSQTPLGLTACHIAAARGDMDSVMAFLGCGPNVNLMAYLGYSFDIKLMTKLGRTVLHSAAETDQLNIVQLLLQAGVDAAARDKDGLTAWDLIKNKDSMEVRSLFSAHAMASFQKLPALNFELVNNEVSLSTSATEDELSETENGATSPNITPAASQDQEFSHLIYRKRSAPTSALMSHEGSKEQDHIDLEEYEYSVGIDKCFKGVPGSPCEEFEEEKTLPWSVPELVVRQPSPAGSDLGSAVD